MSNNKYTRLDFTKRLMMVRVSKVNTSFSLVDSYVR